VAQTVQRNFFVRLSAFNVYIPDYPEADQTLIYNTFSGGFVAIETSTLAVLKKADAGAELDASEQAFVDPEFFDDSVGILTETRAAEEKAWRAYHEGWRSSTRMDVIVSTTLACNFDCTYCCQSDVLDGHVMSEATAARTAEWIAARALEIGSDQVGVAFIGGEPLLQPKRVEQIVREIRRRLSDTTVAFRFDLITNGYFLTPELVERWKPLGLHTAKITLDGDATTHSRTRRSKKKGEDTFQRVFENAVAASHLINVYLTGNYQLDTVHGFIPLIQQLRDAGFKPGSQIKFSPAVAALGAPTDAASGACNWGGSSPEYMVAFTDEARRAGFDPTDLTAVGPCALHRRHSYNVDPEGHIYKCPAFLGKPEWSVGHVSRGLSERYARLASVNPQRLCGSCAHRPSCAGGCVATAWLEAGRSEGVSCEIEFFQSQALEDQLKRKYALATHDSVEEALALFPRFAVDPVPASELVSRRGKSLSLRVLAA
jgi:uncharacterized protein